MNRSNPMQIIQEFQKFKATCTNEGAKAEVERLMREGKISQAQLNQLQSMANQFIEVMNNFK